MHGIQSRRRTVRPRITSWCYSPHPVEGWVEAACQSLKGTEPIQTKRLGRIGGSSMFLWCICNHIDSCLFISVLEEETKTQLEYFASTGNRLVAWRGPLLQEELCPTSLPWWTDHFPEMYDQRNQSFFGSYSSRWVHLGRSRDNHMNNRGPILHPSVLAIWSCSKGMWFEKVSTIQGEHLNWYRRVSSPKNAPP